ncbi:MAG: TetR/AcrR family transcriptional regulator [Rhodospirillaceae bacterium]|nr:MAG: TetR/AcrR family transcriptional regulator [Rhodospirillaceae bacterium]
MGRRAVKKRKRRTAEEIRERLLQAAREQFKAKGYAGATTAAIAKRADVAEMQMFRYFSSKADLFRAAIFTPLTAHFRAFNAMHMPKAIDERSIGERARLYMTELQSFLGEHSKMLITLLVAQAYAEPALGTEVNGLQSYFAEGAALMSARAARSSHIDPATIVRVAFAALLGCITYKEQLFPNAAANEAAIDEAITEFILTALAPHSDLGSTGGGRA